MKRLFFILLITLIGQKIIAQPEKVAIEIFADNSSTSDSLIFRCSISNPTDKNYKYFGYASDWEKKVLPQFWDIIIIKDGISFVDSSWDWAMIHRVLSRKIKLKKHSINKFEFTINFSKLSGLANYSRANTNYKNELYGLYKLRIRYIKEWYDPKNPISLESNWVEINYIKP